MKVIRLKGENFKRLKAFDITLDSDEPIIEVSGKNAQGKTSLLDSIADAIGGGKFSPEEPIRKGEKKGFVYLDLGELKITKTHTPSGPRLEVTNAEGLIYKTPQAILDKIKGNYTFDPQEFALQDTKRQREILLSLVTLDIDLDILDTKRKTIYEERTAQGKILKQIEADLKSYPELEEGLPDLELSMQPIMNAMAQAKETEKQLRSKEGEIEDLTSRIIKNISQMTEFQERIQELRREIETIETENINLEELRGKAIEELRVMPEPQNIDQFTEQLRQREITNRKIRDNQKRKTRLIEAKAKKAEIDNLSSELNLIDQTKEKVLKNCQFPIEGLGFDDIGVTYQDIPLKQTSDTDQIKISMAIAMALNPTLKIITIPNASLLDSDRWAYVREQAIAKGYQVWEELVNESGEIGIYIEDGEIKKINKPRKQKLETKSKDINI